MSVASLDFSRSSAVLKLDDFSFVYPDNRTNGLSKEIRKEKKGKKKITPPPEDVDQGEYQKPDIEEFLTSSAKVLVRDREEMETIITSTSRILIEKLAQFGVEAEVVNVNIGPIITQYELKPAPHVKVSRFQALADDLSLAIKSRSIRVQAPIPGRGLIGIEVPNKEREVIYLKDILLSEQMLRNPSKLAIALGKDIVGTPVVADMAAMPHLLIAGATGSGKSVCINAIICSILFRTTPEELRLVLIDPKRIELSGYEGIPHLIQDVVSDSEEALQVLNWAVTEMERRYELLQHYNVRDINSYNKKIKELAESEEGPIEETLPYIVIIIDEFAEFIGNRIAHGVGNVKRVGTGVNGYLKYLVEVGRLGTAGIHRRKLDVIGIALRLRHHVARELQNLVAIFFQHVHEVDVRRRHEHVNAGMGRTFNGLPGGVDVGGICPGQAADDAAAHFLSD